MPLTPAQELAIDRIINGWREEIEPDVFVYHEGLNDKVNKINSTRDILLNLMEIDEDISDTNATIILGKLKTFAKTAAEELVTLLT